MEITKQNEVFVLKHTTDEFKMVGNVSYDVAGDVDIHVTISTADDQYIGDGHYGKHTEMDTINFGVNCLEENRDKVMAYADSAVKFVLDYFKS